MPGLPNPWIILAVVLAFVAQGFYWDHHGRMAERDAQAVVQARLDKIVTNTIIAEKKKTQDAELALANFKTEVEAENAERERKIAGLRIANGRLVSALGGLWDKNGRPRPQGGGDGPGPGAGAVEGRDATGLGCTLSGTVTDDLLDLARDADLDRSTALACQADLVGITRILNQLRENGNGSP